MKKSRKYISMPIVSVAEGAQIGAVRSLVINPAGMEIAAIVIEQRGWFREQKIIPYTKVKSIGSDAITIDQSANVQRPISLPELMKLIKERANPIGTRVISEDGTVLGVVDEYYVDEETGKITTLEISGKMLESLFKGKALLGVENVLTMGSDVIVVAKDAQSKLEKVDGGLQETIQNFRESTSTLWENTVQKTKELSKNIKDKYDKKEKDDEAGQDDVSDTAGPGSAAATPEQDEPSVNMVGDIEITGPQVVTQAIENAPEPDQEPAEPQQAAPSEPEPAGHEPAETAEKKE